MQMITNIVQREYPLTDSDRGVSPSGETSIVGLFLAVAGGALIVALMEAETLIDLVGYDVFRVFVTLMAAALLAAVGAAYFRHRQRFWDRVADDDAAVRRR